MKKILTIIIVLSFLSTGCAQVIETSKVIWGSSTAALERGRDQALTRAYLCNVDECFAAVLNLGRDQSVDENWIPTKKVFNVFIEDKAKRHIVVMNIRGNVDTTKVGIFFESQGPRLTRIEISSLSSTAKEKVAQAVFEELSLRFSEQARASE